MLHPLIEKEIRLQLETLDLQQQIQVLNFAKSLVGSLPVGIPAKELLEFSGTLSADDATLMLAAIEAGCGQESLHGR